MNDGSIGSIQPGHDDEVEAETAYCIDINTDTQNDYKTRADAATHECRQISDVALSLGICQTVWRSSRNELQTGLSIGTCVVWQRLSVHLGWQCDNVRASYDEIPKATQDEVFSVQKPLIKKIKDAMNVKLYLLWRG